MTCDQIDWIIRAVFAALIKQANGGNITDDMVIKSGFNGLNALAKSECNIDYSIEWTQNGNVLTLSR